MSESDTMFNKQDRRFAAVQLMLSTDPSYDNRTIASTLKMQIWIATNNRNMPSVMKTIFPPMVMVFGVVSNEGHIMPPHIFKVGLKSIPKCTLMCWRVLWSPGAIRWPVADPGVAAGLGAGPQVQWVPGLALEGVLRLCTFLSLALLLPDLNPLDNLLIRWEHHQQDIPQHQSQPDHRPPPSIHRAPTSTCGKGMLLFPDPCRGGVWGWRRQHWIDISFTT